MKCHITYDVSSVNHPAGSAGSNVNGDGAENMNTYCANCHASTTKSGTTVPARPIPASDFHGNNSLLGGGLWPTVNSRPYGFIRNTQNYVYHRPYRGTEAALTGGSATCSGGGSQCAANNGTRTYTPGGSY